MISSIFLILVVGSVLAEPKISKIVSQLIHVRQVVLPGANPTIVVRNKEMSSTSEAILRGFLVESYDAIIIASRKEVYGEQKTLVTYFIVILERTDRFPVLANENRQILVVEREQFTDLLKWMRSFKIRNAVYIVYDEESCSIVFSNEFLGRLESSSRLEVDPLFAATKDLAGTSVRITFVHSPDWRFGYETIRRINASSFLRNFGGIRLSPNNFQAIKTDLSIMTEFYMHRTDFCHVLVPTLNMQKPLLYILIDPFDLYSWLLILATIFAVAFFRSMISRIFTISQFTQNLLNILDSVITGSGLPNMHRDLERQLFGLVLFLFVVLINAYQSLVISYLLSPRFYPELDTLALLNESCCWDNDSNIAVFNLRRFGECSSEYLRNIPDPEVVEANRRMACIIADSTIKEGIDQRNVLHAHRHLRWSKHILHEVPMVMRVMKDPIIAERIQLLSALYFAEGALEKRFQRLNTDDPNVAAPKKFAVSDLLLVWVVLGFGTAVGIVSFLAEMAYYTIMKKFEFIVA